MGQMFYGEQPYRYGTVGQCMRLGPARSSFERLFCGVDVSVSDELIDRSVLDLTNCGDCASLRFKASVQDRTLLAGLRCSQSVR
jgi:hypothetical protein